MDEDKLWQKLCELGGFGEKWRVVERFHNELPLSEDDQKLLESGLGTSGEYVEAGRQQMLRVVAAAFGRDRIKEFKQAVKEQLNEGPKP